MIYFYLIILLELIIVSVVDLKIKKISNYWIMVNLSLAAIAYGVGLYSFQWECLIFPLGTIVVGFLLFLVSIMGAGDSKYLASLFLVLPYHFHRPYLEYVLLSTILVGVILIGMKLISRFTRIKGYALSFHLKGVLSEIRSRFSYAPVLLLAWILLGRHI